MLAQAAPSGPTRRPWRHVVAFLLLLTTSAHAQSAPSSPLDDISAAELHVGPAPSLEAILGKPVLEMVLLVEGEAEASVLHFDWAPPGQRFSPGLARTAMRELLRSGRFAGIRAETEALADGIRLRFVALERFIVSAVRINGGVIGNEETLEVTGLSPGSEITKKQLPKVTANVWQLYRQRGYPRAQVAGRLVDAQEPGRVLVVIDVKAGPPEHVAHRVFQITSGHADPSPPAQPSAGLLALLSSYSVDVGERTDAEQLLAADQDLQALLRSRGWHDAVVEHELARDSDGTTLRIKIAAGPLVRLRFEGNASFDAARLLSALELETNDDRQLTSLQAKLKSFYEERGFFDVAITLRLLPGPGVLDATYQIREGQRLRVVARSYPCLRGSRAAASADEELDGFLDEQLPGGDELLGALDDKLVDQRLAPGTEEHRAQALELDPTHTYSPDVYERALQHLRDLYRSRGYLSASVGPVVPLRRRCDPASGPEQCLPLGQRQSPDITCPNLDNPLPVEDLEPGAQVTCQADASPGLRCEPKVVLSIPIKLGPRTTLWDVQFEGNQKLLDKQLLEAAELDLGAPVSQLKLQQARRRILDLYADEGFAFAAVDVGLELSQDHTRGRARFVVGEREQVRIRDFIVRGARHTSQGVILGRLELTKGGIYRRRLVRESEEQLATLGVFSSITISLQDPEVPAREKIVVVSVQELHPQYIDVKPGISTGEGYRAAFEYGHRNLLARAIQGRLRLQLGYLPDYLIFDSQVRNRFHKLSFGERLERRNTLTFEFPVAKRLRLALDGVDVRDNSRDFGITKRAAIVTLTYRPSRQVSFITGSSFELNDARIFSEKQTLKTYLEANPQLVRLLNVPEGRSFAIALRAGGAWDRTDNPLGATRGTLVSAEIEPVVAFLDKNSAAVDLDRCELSGQTPATCEFKSRFLKVSNRVSGYIPFNDQGLSLALSFRWGANFQLVANSATYPDRLFFFGGADSLRGFLQASVIPQDVADRLKPQSSNNLSGEQQLQPSDVVIRGGDFVINPRAELRIPLTKLFHTAVFVDTGNVWRDIANVDPFVLRYTAGTGLRAITPIGPLAFDYGIKLDRRFYETAFGAFHFSVGLL